MCSGEACRRLPHTYVARMKTERKTPGYTFVETRTTAWRNSGRPRGGTFGVPSAHFE